MIIVSVEELEHAIGGSMSVSDDLKHDKPNASWMIPRGCNKG